MFELANFAETIIKTVQQPHIFCGASINIYWYFFGISFCWNQKKIDRQNSMRIICQYDHIFSHFFFAALFHIYIQNANNCIFLFVGLLDIFTKLKCRRYIKTYLLLPKKLLHTNTHSRLHTCTQQPLLKSNPRVACWIINTHICKLRVFTRTLCVFLSIDKDRLVVFTTGKDNNIAPFCLLFCFSTETKKWQKFSEN